MAKHKSESTYISMDNTQISEKAFSVPLGFGGYLLTIACASNKFDLEVGQGHGMVILKFLSEGSCMPNMNALRLCFRRCSTS